MIAFKLCDRWSSRHNGRPRTAGYRRGLKFRPVRGDSQGMTAIGRAVEIQEIRDNVQPGFASRQGSRKNKAYRNTCSVGVVLPRQHSGRCNVVYPPARTTTPKNWPGYDLLHASMQRQSRKITP